MAKSKSEKRGIYLYIDGKEMSIISRKNAGS